MKPTLNVSERMKKLLEASPEKLAELDAVLEDRVRTSTALVGPLLYNMTDAAKLVGISRSSMWRVVRSGRITPIEIRTGVFKIKRSDIERLTGIVD